MVKPKPIYVEIDMDADLDQLWAYSQNPDLHKQWDLRFTEIDYLPRENEEELQRFLYETKIGFGLKIAGEGESVGSSHRDNGERVSSLKFWTDNPISLIQEGRGYWKYIPTEQGVQFITQYDYDNRFGWAGTLFDKYCFRPLMGWATAWSFDCLRLWLEKGMDPAVSRIRGFIHWIVCFALAFLWIYQGLFPKLLFPDSGELAILRGVGWFHGQEVLALSLLGAGEIIFGLLFVFFQRRRPLFVIHIFLLILLLFGAVAGQPGVLVAPFNPVTLNAAMIVLSVIGLLNMKGLPTAQHCKRKR